MPPEPRAGWTSPAPISTAASASTPDSSIGTPAPILVRRQAATRCSRCAGRTWRQGIPSVWTTYLATDDVDATAAKARDAGGNVMMEPFDVLDAGRMTMIQDPTGAVVGVWQAGRHHGSELANEPGSFNWNELNTRDVAAATRFYEAVFGVEVDTQELAGTAYGVIKVDGRGVGGVRHLDAPEDQVPAHWQTVFAVADCDASLRQVEELGGRKLTDPLEVPGIGRFALVQDP